MRTDSRAIGPTNLSAHAGTIALVLGVLFLAATVFTYVLSLSDSVNPPGWVRVLGLVWLPIGFVGTPIAYVLARKGPGRRLGTVGLAIALLGLLAFVVLQFIAG
jgi:hypothetical protein